MENKLIHSAALNLVDWLSRNSPREGRAYLRLVYDIEVLIMNVTKLIIVFTISLLIGILPLTIATLIGFNVIRRYSFGIHAKNSTVCTISSVILFIFVPYAFKSIGVPNLVVLPIFGVVILLLFLYAPSDTEARPLVGKKKRLQLKKRAIVSGALLMLAVLLFPGGGIKTMLTLGAIYETISLLPISYIILKRKHNNYERYEQKD